MSREVIMKDDKRSPEHQGDVPSDTEELMGDTAASDKLTDRTRVQPGETESRSAAQGNPPHTSGKRVSSPAFGSGISGGALADPGPPKD
jgi:hypothetical protein